MPPADAPSAAPRGEATPARPAPALAAEDVVVRYGTVTVLDGVTLRVPAGACAALVGESGAGKTTLLRCFNALVRPDAGRVRVGGDDVAALDPIALRRRTGYVPQDGGLLPHWTVRRNVALAAALAGAPRDAADAQADEALALVGLEPARFADRHPRALSGGQRQRVAVARALAGGAGVMLLDEPFGALDAITRADVQAAFAAARAERAARRRPFTAVLVTHDLREARRLADVTVVLRGGRVEQAGPFAALQGAPATPYVARLLARAELSAPSDA
jgi:osmoprotectant transport system ATP-binding protein